MEKLRKIKNRNKVELSSSSITVPIGEKTASAQCLINCLFLLGLFMKLGWALYVL